MSYEFDLQSFVDFMMIQSNVNVQIANDKKAEEDVRKWMEETLQPIFAGNRKTLIFEGCSWYITHLKG